MTVAPADGVMKRHETVGYDLIRHGLKVLIMLCIYCSLYVLND